MKKYPPDYVLWFAISGTMFLSILGVWVIMDNLTRDSFRNKENDVLLIAIACAVFGWVAHALAVMCGVLLSGRPSAEHAEDYDDATISRQLDVPDDP